MGDKEQEVMTWRIGRLKKRKRGKHGHSPELHGSSVSIPENGKGEVGKPKQIKR